MYHQNGKLNLCKNLIEIKHYSIKSKSQNYIFYTPETKAIQHRLAERFPLFSLLDWIELCVVDGLTICIRVIFFLIDMLDLISGYQMDNK